MDSFQPMLAKMACLAANCKPIQSMEACMHNPKGASARCVHVCLHTPSYICTCVGNPCATHLITRACPCGKFLQKVLTSHAHAFFMGYLKSMSSAILTSWSKRAAAHFWSRLGRLSCRHRMTRAEPCTVGVDKGWVEEAWLGCDAVHNPKDVAATSRCMQQVPGDG